MTWCLIRADASVEIGSGHIMRCLALANRLAKTGITSVFIARHLPDDLNRLISDYGHNVLVLPHNEMTPKSKPKAGLYGVWLGTMEAVDADDTLEHILPFCARRGLPHIILCDHYALSKVWQSRIRRALKAPLVVIDDLSNRAHDCDVLIDSTYGKKAQDYDALVPEHCLRLIGSQYAMLRPEFVSARAQTLKRRDQSYAQGVPVKTLLIAMGGMDKDNVSSLMLNAVAALPDAPDGLVTEVLVGPGCPHLQVLHELADKMPQEVIIHVGTPSVSELISRADLCIGAAGSSTWERCCLGLPTINIVIADNQKTIADNLSQKGIVEDGGHFENINPKHFAQNILQPLLMSNTKRESLSLASRDICDGRGGERIILSLIQLSKKRSDIQLRYAERPDIDTVYQWQIHPNTRRFFVNSTPPTWNEHQVWMNRKICDVDAVFLIMIYNGQPAGLIRLDAFSDEFYEDAYEVSILTAPEFYGKGIASFSLRRVLEIYRNKPCVAHVYTQNVASLKLFENAGFDLYKDEYYVVEPN